jgi:P27 family predicted phage terminase small subunit
MEWELLASYFVVFWPVIAVILVLGPYYWQERRSKVGGLNSGRPKRPTIQAEREGAEERHINRNEPEYPKAQMLQPPKHISGEAMAVWEHYAPMLEKAGVLTTADVDTLASFCEAVATVREASEKMQDEGKVIEIYHPTTDQIVKAQKNPWWMIWKDAVAEVMRIGARFGLTPSDRARIVLPEDNPTGDNDPSRFLS